MDKAAAYPFGFGLSYARSAYRGLKVRRSDGLLHVSVAVTNTGAVTPEEIVQLYVGFPGRAARRPNKLLRGFKRITLAPGECRIVHMDVSEASLRWWNPRTRKWTLEIGNYQLLVGPSSRDNDVSRSSFSI